MSLQLQNNNGLYIPKRYIFVVLGFFGGFFLFAMRVNINITMVAMTNTTESNLVLNRTYELLECPMHQENIEDFKETIPKGEKYNWNANTQGLILSAYYYGYMLTQILGGYLADKMGAKWMCGGSIFLSSVLTLLTPISARLGVPFLVALRFLVGFAGGPLVPTRNYATGHWAPKMERSRIYTIIAMGAELGVVVSMALSGWLSDTSFLGGWPSAFYVLGTAGIIWFAFWTFLMHESPFVHPTISIEELALFQDLKGNNSGKKPIHPWKSILTSMPLWAVAVATFCFNFGYYVFTIELPIYLSSVLHFNITQNGFMTALPFIMEVIFASIVSIIADKLRESGRLGVTSIRKIMTTLGFVIPAVCMIVAILSGCNKTLVVGMLVLSVTLNGFLYSGYILTPIDMSPDFSGTLYGIANSIGNLAGVIVPAFVGAVISYGATMANWNKIFYLTVAMYIVGAIFFLIFASAELQPWGRGLEPNQEKKPPTKTDEISIISK